MKEEKFIEELKELNLFEGFIIEVSYGIDENKEVIFDEEGMRESFERRMNEVKEILKEVEE